MKIALTLASVACLHACCGIPVRGADPPDVKHPNLLLDREEIEAVKEKIRTQPWAALLEKLKAGVDGLDLDHHDGPRNAALLYAITGDRQYADRFFFPHPVYRQGLLLRTPPETPLKFLTTAVNLPIRLGQEVSLQFVEEGEAGLK